VMVPPETCRAVFR